MFRACTVAALAVLVAFTVSGCASEAVTNCRHIAGSGWQVLPAPPGNAAQLLNLQGVADAGHLVWLGHGADKVMACRYEKGMIYPGCSASRGYVFQSRGGAWKSDGMVMNACDASD
ncbi:MAG TPA: hypothetical protein VFQ88_01255 [Nevskiaceae bacterium]|nr:hypothetical protein [Nevskiaceae bacterium]